MLYGMKKIDLFDMYLLQMFQLELFMRQSSEPFSLTVAGLMAVDKDLALTVGCLWSYM